MNNELNNKIESESNKSVAKIYNWEFFTKLFALSQFLIFVVGTFALFTHRPRLLLYSVIAFIMLELGIHLFKLEHFKINHKKSQKNK